MFATHEKPLPGDLVIRQVPLGTSGSRRTLYFIAVYPQLDQPTTATELTEAVERARLLAQTRGGALQVWREESAAPARYSKLDYAPTR